MIQVTDETWGELRIWRATPTSGDSWGVLSVLRGTPWEPRIPVVSGTSLSHALHGRVTPLMNEIGPDPKNLGRRIPEPFTFCSLIRTCPVACQYCIPGSSKLPDCYEAPLEPVSQTMASFVTLCWRDGYYVIVVEGEEFSIR